MYSSRMTPCLFLFIFPLYLSICLYAGLDKEGIFRLSGRHTEIEELKKRWDNGEIVDIESSKIEVHTVAGLCVCVI